MFGSRSAAGSQAGWRRRSGPSSSTMSTTRDVLNPILRQKGIKSLLGVPLLVAGEVLGVLHVGTLTPRRFDEADVELLQLAADRAALAIEHARLFEAERHARERLEHVQAVTDAALAHLELEELLSVLLPRIRAILSADTCAVLLLDEESNELVARAAVGIEEEVEAGVRIPMGGGFAGRVAAEKRPVILDDVDHAHVLNPILVEKGIKSLLGVPLLVAGEVIGVLHVGTLVHRKFTRDDVELLSLVAERVALAIERAELHEETMLLDQLKQNFVAIASHELRTPPPPCTGRSPRSAPATSRGDALAPDRDGVRAVRPAAAAPRAAARPLAARRRGDRSRTTARRAAERGRRDRCGGGSGRCARRGRHSGRTSQLSRIRSSSTGSSRTS